MFSVFFTLFLVFSLPYFHNLLNFVLIFSNFFLYRILSIFYVILPPSARYGKKIIKAVLRSRNYLLLAPTPAPAPPLSLIFSSDSGSCSTFVPYFWLWLHYFHISEIALYYYLEWKKYFNINFYSAHPDPLSDHADLWESKHIFGGYLWDCLILVFLLEILWENKFFL